MKNIPGKEQFVHNGSKEIISKLGSTYERTLMQRTSSVVSIDAVLLFSLIKLESFYTIVFIYILYKQHCLTDLKQFIIYVFTVFRSWF